MSGEESAEGPIKPPKELPSYFSNHEHGNKKAFIPPTPPQLHPPLQAPSPIKLAPEKLYSSPTLHNDAENYLTDIKKPSSSTNFATPSVPPYPAAMPSASPSEFSTGVDGEQFAQQANVGDHSCVTPESQLIPNAMSENERILAATDNDKTKAGVMDWFQNALKQSDFLSKVANSAKSGMDSVLTTLDPGMKDFIDRDDSLSLLFIGGGSSSVFKEVVKAFCSVFSGLESYHMPNRCSPDDIPQIVGHSFALAAARNSMLTLSSNNVVADEATALRTVTVIVQPFIYQVDHLWFDAALLLAKNGDSEVNVITQSTEVNAEVIETLKKRTPKDYPVNSFAVSVGYTYAELYGGDPDDWQKKLLLYSSSELYHLASTSLALALKQKLIN